MNKISRIVLGIGNIGTRYDGTRHNIGFDVAEELKRKNSSVVRSLKHGTSIEIALDGISTACIKPNTFVNLSGLAIAEALELYQLSVKDILVVVDDFNLPLGTIRYRGKGSAGGHNGLKSLIETIGHDFARLRFGVGPLPEGISVTDFVLGMFTEEEKPLYADSIQRAAESVSFFVNNGLASTMNKFNS